jgi:RNA polymerase-binding transcription factor DksA
LNQRDLNHPHDSEIAVKAETLKKYQAILIKMAGDTDTTSSSLEEAARISTGGDAGGNLSGTPMHLGDLGSEVYNQELNATLLENEDFLRQEVQDALERIKTNSFGVCEECGKKIPVDRMNAVPYARYCMACEEQNENPSANLNDGHVLGWGSTLEDPSTLAKKHRDGEQSPFNAPRSRSKENESDPHAAGTPGGGSAIGGLAGTNIGEGDPVDDLEAAMGGSYDFENHLDDADDGNAFSGRSGGAVGGTPANKRVNGGK